MTSQTGFLLSYIKYGDNDAVLQCFTKEKGFQSFFVKGIYSPKNKKKAYLVPLNELAFTLYSKHGNTSIPAVSKIELGKSYSSSQDVKSGVVIFFIADFLKNILRDEEANPKIYQEIIFFLQELENKNYRAHIIFLIQYLKISGVFPLINASEYLNPESGIFECISTHHLFTKEISEIWKKIIKSTEPYSVHFPAQLKKTLLNSIFIYFQHHHSNFRIPASLEVVQQIFEP